MTIDKQSAFIEELSVTMQKHTITIVEMLGTIDGQAALIQQLQQENMVSFLYFDKIYLL